MVNDLQRASMWKRISAYLLDAILLGIVVVGIAWLMSLAFGYDTYVSKFDEACIKYEEKYGVDLDADYTSLTDTEKSSYDAAFNELSSDNEAQYAYSMMINLTFTIISISILIGYILLELVVPLLLKNGQTLGKKVFGIALMRTDGVKMSNLSLFVRTILGKYTVETMIPVLIVVLIIFNGAGLGGTVALALIALLQLILLGATRTRSAIHDLLACTVAVDFTSQLIFNTPEELMEYKKKLHAEESLNKEW